MCLCIYTYAPMYTCSYSATKCVVVPLQVSEGWQDITGTSFPHIHHQADRAAPPAIAAAPPQPTLSNELFSYTSIRNCYMIIFFWFLCWPFFVSMCVVVCLRVSLFIHAAGTVAGG